MIDTSVYSSFYLYVPSQPLHHVQNGILGQFLKEWWIHAFSKRISTRILACALLQNIINYKRKTLECIVEKYFKILERITSTRSLILVKSRRLHHHKGVLTVWILLTLSHNLSLSVIVLIKPSW